MAHNETARYTELQPSGNMILKRKGLYQITGLAWSGRGKIRQVDVSTDGGTTWAASTLQPPVLDRTFTRFRIPWHWDGKPTTIKNRAINAIINWHIDRDGVVSHVYDNDNVTSTGEDIGIDNGWD